MQNALALFRVKMAVPDVLYLMVRTRENVFLIYVKGGNHGKYLFFIHISVPIVFVCVSNLLAFFSFLIPAVRFREEHREVTETTVTRAVELDKIVSVIMMILITNVLQMQVEYCVMT
jgi:hypothetical protein